MSEISSSGLYFTLSSSLHSLLGVQKSSSRISLAFCGPLRFLPRRYSAKTLEVVVFVASFARPKYEHQILVATNYEYLILHSIFHSINFLQSLPVVSSFGDSSTQMFPSLARPKLLPDSNSSQKNVSNTKLYLCKDIYMAVRKLKPNCFNVETVFCNPSMSQVLCLTSCFCHDSWGETSQLRYKGASEQVHFCDCASLVARL